MAMSATPIAIVGIGCRFPSATGPEQLWNNISEGRSAWTDVPEDRYNWKSFHHPNLDIQGAHNQRGGHFLSQNVAAFDARFFGLAPAEAGAMDPQQRILLEVAYEALENAGLPVEKIQGSNTGVFVATFTHDYELMNNKDPLDLPKYLLSGIGQAILANRISYTFDFKGPSITIDTACSGSLVAVHQACQSLRTGETDMVLAGGTNLILTPDVMIPMSLLHFLNSDGRCYAFDSRGDGYGRGEGAGIVVLKRLDDAMRAGDNVRGVIRSTGVGQDGKTSGITLPSRAAQESLINSVYRSAGLDKLKHETGYFEAHGTGTLAGDKTELGAIGDAFGDGDSRDQDSPLYIGSIKTNIGHLESSSGIAGFIKAALVVEKGLIPPTPYQRLKEGMISENWNIQVPRKLENWPKDRLRRVSVNSFGYGGTNAHAIVETVDEKLLQSRPEPNLTDHRNDLNLCSSPPMGNDLLTPSGSSSHRRRSRSRGSRASDTASETSWVDLTNEDKRIDALSDANNLIFSNEHMTEQALRIFPVTAKSESSLRSSMDHVWDWVCTCSQSTPSRSLKDLAYTLSSRRSIMPWRQTVVAATPQDVMSAMDDKDDRSRIKNKRPSGQCQVNFVFTGQGAQWFAMGRELITTSIVFKKSLIRSSMCFKRLGASWDLIDELLCEESRSRIHDSEIGQPASTAIQIALVDLFSSLSISPDVVLGHSSGEIAAAYAANILDQDAALSVSYHRGFLSRRSKQLLNVEGAMLAVGLGESDAVPYLAQLKSGAAVIAASNSPTSITVSGDEPAIVELKAILDEQSIFARRLQVDTAYHSHHMNVVAASYFASIDGLQTHAPKSSVRFVSSVTGQEKSSHFNRSYWVQNLVSKVAFREAIETACQGLASSFKEHIFVEIGSHHALAGPLRDTIKHLGLSPFDFTCLPSLVRNHNAVQTILETSATLFERGYPVDLQKANSLDCPTQQLKLVQDLAPYPWDHTTTYWSESRLSKDYRLRPHPYHDLLGIRILGLSSQEFVWRHVIGRESLPWLQDHVVDNCAVFPASGYLVMAIEAMTQEYRSQGVISKYIFRNVSFTKALAIPEAPATIELQLSLRAAAITKEKGPSAWKDFQVSSVHDGKWSENCHGSIMVEFSETKDEDQEAAFMRTAQEEKLHRLQEETSRKLNSEQLYAELQSKGNHYGTTFAIIEDFRIGLFDGIGTINIPDFSKVMPSSFTQPHVVHPATLDALLHSSLPLFAQHSVAGAFMTVGIEEMTVCATIATSSGSKLQFTSSVTPISNTSATLDIATFQMSANGSQELVLQIRNGELRAVSDSSGDAVAETDHMTYGFEWGLETIIQDLTVFDFNPIAQDDASGSAGEKLQSLNRAASLFVSICLSQTSEHTVHSQYKEYFGWMQRFAASEQSMSLNKGLSNSDIMSCLEGARHLGVEGEALYKIGNKLTTILSTGQDALSLMLEDGLLNRAYADDASARCYEHLIEFVKRLVFQNPKMRVLEVGSGTGGATIPLFEALSQDGELPFERYDFTDVSAGFFERVSPHLKRWESVVHFQTLDIGQSPVMQGFIEESYDLVIASNSLHVTSHLNGAISNARSLLKDEGRLLLIETTNAVPFVNFIYGLVPGWYCGAHEGRQDSPLQSVDQWSTRLSQGDFYGLELAMNDLEGPGQRASFLAARACSKPSAPVKSLSVSIMSLPDCTDQHTAFVEHTLSLLNDYSSENASKMTLPLSSISKETVYVILDDKEVPFLTRATPIQFKSITNILTNAQNLLWVSIAHDDRAAGNPEIGITTGLVRTARAENNALKLVTLEMRQSTLSDSPDIITKIWSILYHSFLNDSQTRSEELEFVHTDGRLLVPRLKLNKQVDSLVRYKNIKPEPEEDLFHQSNRPLKLHVETPGLLDSLRFIDDHQQPLGDDEIEVQAFEFGVNFKDVVVALGQIKPTVQMAAECSGYVTQVGSNFRSQFRAGDRVFCFAGTPYATHSRVCGWNAVKLPDSMSLTIGASIPVVFATAYHCLVELAHLQRGQTVLIHAAAGGVGQAAIRISQYLSAEIFVTVGSTSKRHFLMDTYSIPEDHMFSSRSVTFKRGIMRMTKDTGVDVVLNSLTGELLRESLACVSRFGSFIEIGKLDIHSKNLISLETFDRGITFASVDLALLCEHKPQKVAQMMTKVMALFKSGDLAPVEPITTMPLSGMVDAFRLLQSGKLIGKLVLQSDVNTMVKVLPAKPAPVQLSAEGVYIIAGGMGGLGLDIGRFMASRGAKQVALLTRRRDIPALEQQRLSGEFQQLGATVSIVSCDISDAAQCRALEKSLRNMPPVRGVVQAAMALQDEFLDKMTLDQFKFPLQSKVHGTQNLFEAFNGPSLDFFVMLSSDVSIIGGKGSANYAAGNAFQDALANTPNSSTGTSCVSINLGPMKETGVLARDSKLEQILSRQGFIPLTNTDMFTVVEYAMSGKARQDNQIVIGFNRDSLTGSDNEHMLSNPMLNHLPKSKLLLTNGEQAQAVLSPKEALAMASNADEARSIIAHYISQKVSTLVALDLEMIAHDVALDEFGMDSLVMIELKNWITRNFQAALQTSDVSDAKSISALSELVAKKSDLTNRDSTPKDEQSAIQEKSLPTEDRSVPSDLKTRQGLPKQPLPELHDTLDYFLKSAGCISTPEELTITEALVRDFVRPGGEGERLHERLVKRSNDPNIENWISGLDYKFCYLQQRSSLVPYSNYFGSHPIGVVPPQPAERATTISLAAFECKRALEAGNISPSYLVDKLLDREPYEGLFNMCREPRRKEDAMVKYHGNDYLVAFRQGRPFKVNLMDGPEPILYAKLKATFEAILETVHGETSWISALTVDGRNEWANNRNFIMSLGSVNAASMTTIEAAAFIVCLDDASPETPSERAHQFYFGNGVNRWHDKTLQLVICENGASATVCEHSILDGTSLFPLKRYIAQAIEGEQPESLLDGHGHREPQNFDIQLEELTLSTTPELDSRIIQVRDDFQKRIKNYSFAAFTITNIASPFFRTHKCAPRSSVQLIIQLACHRFFGYNPSASETVAMSTFQKGRVDLSQTVWPPVIDFCKASCDPDATLSARRALFFDAAASLSKSLARCSKGYGFARYMCALQWVLEEGEEMPKLFEDEVYKRSRSERISTDSLETDIVECGMIQRDPESFWIHFQPTEEGVLFSVWGNEVSAEEFQAQVERAALDVRETLG